MENKPHENGFPRRSKDQKSTPVNVSTYSTQRRDKEKKESVRGERANFTRLVLGWLAGSFSAVSKPNFATKYALESSRRDLHNALLCTDL